MKNNNTYIKRQIDSILSDWKIDTDRKPLLLRGARQVGKSRAVREFALQFENYVEINFEELPEIHALFQSNVTPTALCENLTLYLQKPIIPGKTLLFFDEIQTCLPAITSLRFFYEKMPELHLIAAGSLLEFALSELPSFGVGRVRSVFMYPLSFNEFLGALGETELCNLKQHATSNNPLLEPFHQKLLELCKKFFILGGMPEVVSKYVQTHNFMQAQKVLDDLVVSIKADFTKYKKRVPSSRIAEVFDAVALQMGGKFVYTKAATQASNLHIKEALDLLILAGLVIPVTHTSANGIPLGAERDPKKRKMLLFDTGIFQRISGLNVSEIIAVHDFSIVNKGAIAELFVGLEMIKYANPMQQENLYYWQRETASGNAEVDYVIQQQYEIIPVEVKSSGRGSMNSLFQFLKEKNRSKGIRISLENFSKLHDIVIYPLYAVSSLCKAEPL